MPRQTGQELQQSFLGDLILGQSGDLKVTTVSEQSLGYIMSNRVKANEGDWGYKGIGANLLRFIGEKNTRENGDKIKQSIVFCLTFDSLINKSILDVRVVPISMTSVAIFIKVNGENMGTPIQFSYTSGFDMVRA